MTPSPFMAELRPRFREAMTIEDSATREAAMEQLKAESGAKLPPATLDDVVAQIEHTVKSAASTTSASVPTSTP